MMQGQRGGVRPHCGNAVHTIIARGRRRPASPAVVGQRWSVVATLAVAVAAAMAGCGDGGDVGGPAPSVAPTSSSTPTPTTTTPPGNFVVCTAESEGFRLRYPATWSTNDPQQARPCRFYHPAPFTVPPESEAPGLAIAVKVEPVPMADIAVGPEGSLTADVLALRETTVAGRPAVRAETSATGEGFLAPGVRGVVYYVDFEDRTLLATTFDTASAGTLASNVAVLDQMMTSLERLPTLPAECSAAAEGPSVEIQPGLPDAVAATRADIVSAAVACDYAALAGIAARGGGTFTYSFGAGGDPAGYWMAAEDEGRPMLRTLVRLLETPFASRPAGDVTQFVWPSAYAYESWADVPPAERDGLRAVYDDEDLQRFEDFGVYAGHRIGIDERGVWMFFVAGD